MDLNTIATLPPFLYGAIYHLMDYNNDALLFLEQDNTYNYLSDPLKQYILKVLDYRNIKTLKSRIQAPQEHLNHLKALHNELSQRISSSNYFDENLLSRKRFRTNPTDLTADTALINLEASILYILRSHTHFWTKKTSTGSRVSNSKEALNDLVQAEALLRDLEIGFRVNVKKRSSSFILSSGHPKLKILDNGFMTYGTLLFFLNLLARILRANIYRKIGFNQRALDIYLQVFNIYESLVSIERYKNNTKHKKKIYFATLSKAYFEASKIHLDNGNLIEALILQIACLNNLAVISFLNNQGVNTDKVTRIIESCRNTEDRLALISSLFNDVLLRDVVVSLFLEPGDLKNLRKKANIENSPLYPTILPSDERTFHPQLFASLGDTIFPEHRLLCAEVMARIGFILHTIRSKFQLEKKPVEVKLQEGLEEELEECNRVIREQIKEYLKEVDGFESELGIYTLFLLKDHSLPGEQAREFYSKRIERLLPWSAIKEFPPDTPIDTPGGFCGKLARHSFINARNISSSGFRVSHFLSQRGYKNRGGGHRQPVNKLVVLKRWQSFNPKVPRPNGQEARGGGYFLFWQGKGIVIDPGYDFIQNFYEEGFSIDDIDAILVTHTHPDHDDELNTILTLLAEWNEKLEIDKYLFSDTKKKKNANGAPKKKYIDLFLNEGAYRKYSSWLYADPIMVAKAYVLQHSAWDKQSESSKSEHRRRDSLSSIDLRQSYGLKIRTVPAWHDALIDKHSSVGVIFDLYEKPEEGCVLQIGFTGDTERYPAIGKAGDDAALRPAVEDYYKDVDILIAHLGDIKLRELLSHSRDLVRVLTDLTNRWLDVYPGLKAEEARKTLIDYLISYDLYGLSPAELRRGKTSKEEQLRLLARTIKELDRTNLRDYIRNFSNPKRGYVYKNHLGLTGLFHMFMKFKDGEAKAAKKLMIVGELPEELKSYRHLAACILGELADEDKVRCLTGDLGLTVGLPTRGITYGAKSDQPPKIAIRCLKCNQNNELIAGIKEKRTPRRLPHYHDIAQIQETCLPACDSRIAWFCLDDHGRTPDYCQHEFLLSPELRSIW